MASLWLENNEIVMWGGEAILCDWCPCTGTGTGTSTGSVPTGTGTDDLSACTDCLDNRKANEILFILGTDASDNLCSFCNEDYPAATYVLPSNSPTACAWSELWSVFGSDRCNLTDLSVSVQYLAAPTDQTILSASPDNNVHKYQTTISGKIDCTNFDYTIPLVAPFPIAPACTFPATVRVKTR